MATEAFQRRWDAVQSGLRQHPKAVKRSLEDSAESEAARLFDPNYRPINARADRIRRSLFKLSVVCCYLHELRSGSRHVNVEADHRRRLIFQSSADYLLMLREADFPPPFPLVLAGSR